VLNTRITDFLAAEDPDIICVQETKIDADLEVAQAGVFGDAFPYRFFCSCTTKKGYAGTAVFCKVKPLSVRTDALAASASQASNEGRCIVMEFSDFYLVNTYVPNSGMKLERLEYRTSVWDPALSACLTDLDKTKPVVWTGDLNVAHGDDDVNDPTKKRNKVPGFTDGERENFGLLVGGLGHVTEEQAKKRTLMVGRPGPDAAELSTPPFVDAFRQLYGDGPVVNAEKKKKKAKKAKKTQKTDEAGEPGAAAGAAASEAPGTGENGGAANVPVKRRYSFWSYRFNAKEKDNGWRLDYFVVSRRFMGRVKRCEVREDFYKLSDHCPVVLELE
jgi:exodeoxyribonuclease III